MTNRAPLPPDIMLTLMSQAGMPVPDTPKVEMQVSCWNKQAHKHGDKTPSMSVNRHTSVYYCHACGEKGNAWTFCQNVLGDSKREAAKRLLGLGQPTLRVKSWKQMHDDAQRPELPRGRLPACIPEIPTTIKHEREPYTLVATHDYKDVDGSLLCRVGRYRQATELSVPRPKKTIRPYTPATDRVEGAWWWCAPTNPGLPDCDRVDLLPLYGLERLVAYRRLHRDTPKEARPAIYLVEGEKCADAMNAAIEAGGFPYIALSLWTGSKASGRHDLEPLRGQRVVVVADPDEQGRLKAKATGKYLHGLDCLVSFLMPQQDGKEDVGDAAINGGWDGAKQWAKANCGIPLAYRTVHPDPTSKAPGGPNLGTIEKLCDNEYFRILGHKDGCLHAYNKDIQADVRPIPFERMAASVNALVPLAPEHFWFEIVGTDKIGRAELTAINNALHASAARMGFHSQDDEALGLGAARVSHGQFEFNLGDRVLQQDDQGRLSKVVQLDQAESHFRTESPIALGNLEEPEDPSVGAWRKELYEAIIRCRFKSRDHAQAFLGFLVSSIIGGALEFRPHIWITAPPRSGKTFLLQNVLKPVLGDLRGSITHGTVASVARHNRANSLALTHDEFALTEGDPDTKRTLNNILTLARSASSGDDKLGRVLPNGELAPVLRFSLCLIGVNRPFLSEQDDSRFFHISLKTGKQEEWNEIKEQIGRIAGDRRKMMEVRRSIVQGLPRIVDRVNAIEGRLSDSGLDQRRAYICAVLTAGAEFLKGERIRQPIISHGSVESNPFHLLELLMDAQIQDPAKRITTVGEMCKDLISHEEDVRQKYAVGRDETTGYEYKERIKEILSRYGFRPVAEDRIYMAPNTNTQTLLKGSDLARVSITEQLEHMPGTSIPREPTGRRKRMRVGGLQRSAICIERLALERIGFIEQDEETEELPAPEAPSPADNPFKGA